MSKVVLDSNVIINWLLDSPDVDSQDRLCVEYLIENNYVLVAPKLLMLEVLGILCWRYKLKNEMVKSLWQKVLSYEWEWVESDVIDDEGLVDLMYQQQLTSYDAWYLQVAWQQECCLITHDKALLRADKKACVTPEVFLRETV